MCWVLTVIHLQIFPVKSLHPNLYSHLLNLLPEKSFAELTLQNLLICSLWLTQLKVIKTTVTSMLLHNCWPTKIWGSVLPVDHGSGKEQYPKINNRREEANGQWNRSEDCCHPLAAVTPMLTIAQFQLHTTFSPLGAMSGCIGLWGCGAPLQPDSDSLTGISHIPHTAFSPFSPGSCLAPLLSSLAQLRIGVILSSHLAGGWQSLPTVSASGCYFSR